MISFTETSDAYHANPAIGSTDARNLLTSPQLFADALAGMAQRTTDALLFGIGTHCGLLEPERFAREYAIKPKGMSFATTEGKAWRAAQGGRPIIDAADAQHIQCMHARMPEEVREIFANCQKEVTVRTQIQGIEVQCRPDLWNFAGREFFDLKTIDSIGKIDRPIAARRYDVQIAWYRAVIEAETGAPVHSSPLIFVEKAPPYRWRIVEMDEDYLDLGKQAVEEVLSQISARRKSGCWDDPGDVFHIARPPEWLLGDFRVTDEGIDL